jgi:hypothetical protein
VELCSLWPVVFYLSHLRGFPCKSCVLLFLSIFYLLLFCWILPLNWCKQQNRIHLLISVLGAGTRCFAWLASVYGARRGEWSARRSARSIYLLFAFSDVCKGILGFLRPPYIDYWCDINRIHNISNSQLSWSFASALRWYPNMLDLIHFYTLLKLISSYTISGVPLELEHGNTIWNVLLTIG